MTFSTLPLHLRRHSLTRRHTTEASAITAQHRQGQKMKIRVGELSKGRKFEAINGRIYEVDKIESLIVWVIDDNGKRDCFAPCATVKALGTNYGN